MAISVLLGWIVCINLYAYDFEQGGIYYNLNTSDMTLTVTSGDKGYVGDVVIPDEVVYNTKTLKVVEIGNKAFRNSKNLSSITIGKNVKVISDNAFYFCEGLTELTIPSNVTTLGERVFEGSKYIKKLVLEDGVESLNSGEWANGETNFAYPWMLSGHENLPLFEEIYLGRDVSPGFWGRPFQGQNQLTKLTIGQYVTEANFSKCTAITNITSYSQNPKGCVPTFENTVYASAVLVVPYGTKAEYESAFGWSNFFNIVEDAPTYDLSISSSGGGSVIFEEATVCNGTQSFNVEKDIDVTLLFQPDEGCCLKKVTLNTNDITSKIKNNTYTIKNISENTNVVTVFEELPITLTIQHADNGTVSIDVPRNQSYKTTITPSEGWEINTVTLNGEDVTNDLSIRGVDITPELDKDAIINVVFESKNVTKTRNTLQSNVKVRANGNTLTIDGVKKGQTVSLYDVDGRIIRNIIANGDKMSILLPTGKVYIIETEGKVMKTTL